MITVKSKYGLAAMIDLATHKKSGPQQMKNIAGRHGIPEKYLEQVLTELKRDGLISSTRGAQGGYQLAKPAKTILILDIIQSLEGSIHIAKGHKGCRRLDNYWESVDEKIETIFKESLADVAKTIQKNAQVLTYAI